MIPVPPLNEAGELAASRWSVLAALVPGILAACCVCKRGSVYHWKRDGRYVPLHEGCAPRLLEEWEALIASGQTEAVATTGRLAGAYARRAAARQGGTTMAPPRTVSASLGSPYFRPGMAEGEPWVAVAEMPDGVPLVTPCGSNEEHARRVNGARRAATANGNKAGHAGQVPLGGWVVDPTGAAHDRWDVRELSNRVDSASLAE